MLIKTEDIPTLIQKAGKLVFKAEAERELIKLLEAKDQIERAIEEVKETIYKAGMKALPDFRGVAGDEVSFYITKGEQYTFSGDKETLPAELVKEVSYKKFNSYAVAEYCKNNKLPAGITKQDKPKLIIRRINTQNEKLIP